jgi:hypothetical protein
MAEQEGEIESLRGNTPIDHRIVEKHYGLGADEIKGGYMSTDRNESFVRWQGRSIEQLGFVNNLLIGLATGLLAFETQLAFDDKASLIAIEKCVAIASIISVFLSSAIGCFVAWNRLRSFHFTAKIARKREKNDRAGIEKLRDDVRDLDENTWKYLEYQTISFALGGLLLLAVTLIRYLR